MVDGKKKVKKNRGGLGKAIINSRFRVKDSVDHRDGNPERRHGLEDDDEIGKDLRSVTQERDLDEFLSTAQLAGTDFTAERRNVTILPGPGLSTDRNRYLLSTAEEQEARKRQREEKARLRVPRRPGWTPETTNKQLDRLERESFLEWRRGLAELQDDRLLLLTPFERNLEVWRQLWRVVERSHLVVQIVDARNPLLFRCPDLEDYVQELDPRKRTMILVNKADLLTESQRMAWASWFKQMGLRAAFFSAKTSQEDLIGDLEEEEGDELDQSGMQNDQERGTIEKALPNVDNTIDHDVDPEISHNSLEQVTEDLVIDTDGDADEWESASDDSEVSLDELDDVTRIVSVSELEELLLRQAPRLSDFANDEYKTEKTMIGLVGYPNVGKSSTINALLGAKKVSVSSTPGKTKHFQTIHLSENIVLCDCPGLVFPNFASTKADLVCDGVLPIDQLREYTGPVALVAQRIPQDVLETIYGIKIHTKPIDEGGLGIPSSEEILTSYAVARGFTRSSQGNPDEARAARFILKDYVNGKLLYCHCPPHHPGGPDAFNSENRELAKQRYGPDGEARKKTAPTSRVSVKSVVYDPTIHDNHPSTTTPAGPKSRNLDSSFFKSVQDSDRPKVAGRKVNAMGRDSARVQIYGHQNRLGNDGRPVEVEAPSNPGRSLTGHEARALRAQAILEMRQAVRENGGGPDDGEEEGVPAIKGLPKKHFKPTRQKQRSGAGYV